ncbi:hypothetical protein PG994_013036 [Apiospora phragmitis]|uniref:Uncharacterized protein n=1 Tax=Apiospora phragmitis TaxID=2905665 RepID=A0ABR1T7H5_9PEZI
MCTILYLSTVCSLVLYVVYLRLLPQSLSGDPLPQALGQAPIRRPAPLRRLSPEAWQVLPVPARERQELCFHTYQFITSPPFKPLVVLENQRPVEYICPRRNRYFDREPLTSSIIKKMCPAWRT